MEKLAPLSVYAWDRCFLLQARSFVLTKHSKPYRRPSATVIVAGANPFVLKTNHGVRRQYQGVIVAPYVLRQSIVAEDSDISIVDAGIGSEAYRRLLPRLAPHQVVELNADELARLKPVLRQDCDCAKARKLVDGILDVVCPGDPAPLPQGVAAQLLDHFTLGTPLQGQLGNLSDTRLRAMFSENIGCSPAQYRRWLDTWKAVAGWRPGLSLEALAKKAGIKSTEDVELAINELFGISPDVLFGSGRVRFHNCNA